MAIKNITSTDPKKAEVVKQFKDQYSASKVTNVKYDTVKNIYTANCFRKFEFLGNKTLQMENTFDQIDHMEKRMLLNQEMDNT
tara:strand:+ start:99 stop:347 length:249 start_codon:yes stop_codon:yes gene_type:complete